MLASFWSRCAATGLVLVSELVGCSSNHGSAASADDSGAGSSDVSAASGAGTVGAGGGTVATGDHQVSIQVPPGALDSDVTITIVPIAAPAPGVLGQSYEIGPTGTQFHVAATITFEYASDTLGGAPPSEVAVSTLVGGAWQPVSVPTLDAKAQTISGTTTHLSPYALAAIVGSGADGGAGPDSGAKSDGGTSGDSGAEACATTCNGACVDLQSDSANCGACGVSCSTTAPSTSKCALGRCVTTLTQFNAAASFAGLVIVGSEVVWADNYNDFPNFVYASLLSVPTTGGAMSTVVSLKSSPCGAGASYLQTDGTNLYFAGSGICSYPLAGGTPTAIVPGNVAAPMGYAQVAQKPYWVDNADGLATYDASAQMATSLVPAGGHIFAYVLSDATRLYWLEGAGDPTSQSGGTLYALPLAGGTPATLATNLPDVSGATLGPDAFYGIGGKGTGIGKVPLVGGAMQLLYTTPSPQTTRINSLAVDTSNVYWAESTSQTRAIHSMPLGGGSVSTLWAESAKDAANAVPAMLSDGTSLYWVTWDTPTSSRVMKVTAH